MRVAALVLMLVVTPAFALRDHLIVHEWGTFTALQDENGRAIGGININDEALPKFVHRIGPGLFSDENGSKGIAIGHPDVTMRLETPVMYFYPTETSEEKYTLNVSATFVGGVLSEFYPNAVTTMAGKPSKDVPSNISSSMRGGLTWNNIQLGSKLTLPITNSHVWIAPRAVDSSPVTVGMESEQYIFYRGAGHFDAPIKVIRSQDGKSVTVQDSGLHPDNGGIQRRLIPPTQMWLAEFRADGTCAYERLTDQRIAGASNQPPSFPATFAADEFTTDHVAELRKQMREALTAAGLYEKEAEAMLETWKLSYFKSPGQRLFFMVPREWTDRVLPLEISHRCELVRVMVGRIELVTPEQGVAAARLVDPKAKLDNPTAIALRKSLGRFAEPIMQDAARKRTPVAVKAVVN